MASFHSPFGAEKHIYGGNCSFEEHEAVPLRWPESISSLHKPVKACICIYLHDLVYFMSQKITFGIGKLKTVFDSFLASREMNIFFSQLMKASIVPPAFAESACTSLGTCKFEAAR